MSNLKAASEDSKLAASPSAAIREGVVEAMSTATKTPPLSSLPHQVRQRRPADAFLAARVPNKLSGLRSSGKGQESLHNANVFGPALISLGPNTDAAIDRFKLGDEVLPKLRALAGTVRSSRWEAVFRSPQWDLTYEQAFVLSKALLADLQGMPTSNPEFVKVSKLVLFWAPC
jgi:hypothetical protein